MTESLSEPESPPPPIFTLTGFNPRVTSTNGHEFNQVVDLVNHLLTNIKALQQHTGPSAIHKETQKGSKARCLYTTTPQRTFHNDPALVEIVTTLTTKVAELGKASLLKIPRTPHSPTSTDTSTDQTIRPFRPSPTTTSDPLEYLGQGHQQESAKSKTCHHYTCSLS